MTKAQRIMVETMVSIEDRGRSATHAIRNGNDWQVVRRLIASGIVRSDPKISVNREAARAAGIEA